MTLFSIAVFAGNRSKNTVSFIPMSKFSADNTYPLLPVSEADHVYRPIHGIPLGKTKTFLYIHIVPRIVSVLYIFQRQIFLSLIY